MCECIVVKGRPTHRPAIRVYVITSIPHQRGFEQKQINVRDAMAHVSKKLSLPTLDRVAREVMHDIHQHINMGLIPWFAHVCTVLRIHTRVVCQLGWESSPRVKVRWILP